MVHGPEVCSEKAVEMSDADWMGFVPDARQREVMEGDTRRLLLLCSRQWGKSTVAAAIAAKRAMENAQRLVVCVSPTLRQTGELVLKVRDMVDRAGMLAGRGGPMGFVLKNGTRVVGLPGIQRNLRAYSAPVLVVVDEAAQVPDEVYLAVRPMLAAGNGELIVMSTPYGQRGFFYEAWTGDDPEWRRVEVKATECPRISARFLEEERRSMGDEWFEQEYLCRFLGSVDGIFPSEWMDQAEELCPEVEALRCL